MTILKIRQTQLGQIGMAIDMSMDYVDNCDDHLDFLELFNGRSGYCENMNYDSYRSYWR